jgi:predicted DNA-binding transcriptional regulator AlpA
MNPSFGRANAPRAAEPSGPRRFGIDELPLKGIRYSRSHLRRMWLDGKFPPPDYLSERKPSWSEDALDTWIAERVAASEKERKRKKAHSAA